MAFVHSQPKEKLQYPFFLFQKADSIDVELLEERSVVIYQTNKQENIQPLHKQLITMGMDPVLYYEYQEVMSSPFITQLLQKQWEERSIKFIIWYNQKDDEHHIYIHSLEPWISQKRITAYQASRNTLPELLFTLAMDIRKTATFHSNFVRIDQPQKNNIPTLKKGNVYPTIPTQLPSIKIAVMRLKKTDITQEDGESTDIMSYNHQIDSLNQLLEEAFQIYPYKYEWVEDQSNQELYTKGFQLVLRFITATSPTIRQALSYKEEANPTVVSTSYNEANERTLIEYDKNTIVTKFYFTQTIQEDIYQGRYWDAHPDLYTSLRSFIINSLNQLK